MNTGKTKKDTPVICVCGLKNSGKTTLIEAIIPCLADKNIKTAVIKHHGHGFGAEIPDKPGTDTYRFLKSGAYGTIVYDESMYALVKRANSSAKNPEDFINMFSDADMIIIEGAKDGPWPRIVMLRTGQSLEGLWGVTKQLICAVTDPGYDTSLLPHGLPRFDFGDFRPVADLIIDRILSE